MGSGLLKTAKRLILRTFYSYDGDVLASELRSKSVLKGDVLFVHASWLPSNGFMGSPKDFIEVLKGLVTESGAILMPSMTYQGISSREFLSQGKVVNLKYSASAMGLLSEVFRRGKGSIRSVSATHPILGWGKGATEILTDVNTSEYPFGKESPFAKLADAKAKILLIDTPFNAITYNHYLEHILAQELPGDLYDSELYEGKVIDFNGAVHQIQTRVLNSDAHRLRIDKPLYGVLNEQKLVAHFRVGNTRFTLVECEEMKIAAEQYLAHAN